MKLAQEGIFVLRLSVVDQNLSLCGYKLMFFEDDKIEDLYDKSKTGISKKVLRYVIDFGIENFSGNKPVFIPVNEELVKNEFVSFLPEKNIYFELLSIEPSFEVLEHLENLRSKGFRFAVDENLFNESFLNCVDIVEMDPKKYMDDPDYLKNIISFLHQKKKKVLAINVSSKNEFLRFKEYGFDFFCGDFLVEKTIVERKARISPSKATLINLYNQIVNDAEISKIEDIFKKSPDLSFKLLKLINSAYFSLGREISSIRHALVLLGLKNLRKWVLYLLYSEDYSNVKNNPYFVQALLRAKMMEKFCEKICLDEDEKEKAYLVGLFSNLDMIIGIPMEEIFGEISVDKAVKDALLEKKGKLGRIYSLILFFEKEMYDQVKQLAQELGISITDILLIETVSIVEVEKSKF